MIVVDAPNTKVHHFDRYWSNGKMKGFEVYVAELIDSVEICAARNIHHRTEEEILKVRTYKYTVEPLNKGHLSIKTNTVA